MDRATWSKRGFSVAVVLKKNADCRKRVRELVKKSIGDGM